MDVRNNLIRNVVILVGIVAFFIVCVLALLRLDMHLKIQAMNECSQLARLDRAEKDGGKVSYPLVEFYDKCIGRFGIE